MKYFCVADIHGYYSLMIKSLNEKGFDINNDNHKVILIGDAFDRGSETIMLYEWIKSLIEKDKLIYIRGNHEDLLCKAIYKRIIDSADYWNGTADTIIDFARTVNPMISLGTEMSVICENAYLSGITNFIRENTIPYFETDNYIFTHGYIPVDNDDLGYPIYKENWRESSEKDFYYSRWRNGMDLCMNYNIKEPNKTIVVGHYHTSYGNLRAKLNWDKEKTKYIKSNSEFEDKSLFTPFYADGIIAIDGCVHYTGYVNCVVIED